jgi:hypothetical protein
LVRGAYVIQEKVEGEKRAGEFLRAKMLYYLPTK